MNISNIIHIGKQTKIINGQGIDTYIVPALAFQRKDNPNPKKIPHPLGKDYIVFDTLEEAKEAVEKSGFSWTIPESINQQFIEKKVYHTSYDDVILDALIQLANDLSPTVAASAIFALGEIGHIKTLDLLIDKIGEDNEIIRTNATDAIVKYGIKSFNKLLNALEDENWVKRNSAVICLGKLTDNTDIDIQKMVVPLFKRLKDPNNIVKSSTALTLGKVYKTLKERD